MKNIAKKVISMFLVAGLLSSLAIASFAAPAESTEVVTADSEYYLTAEEIMNSDHFSAEEIAEATADGSIILGGFDAPVSALEGNGARIITGQVWCRTYATYNSDKGVSVNIELYVPWYYFTNPKFTAMSGTVNVILNNQKTSSAFAAIAAEDKTIDADVDTGAKASSGTKGRVDITGWASGTNIAAGAGVFTSSYEITIP